MHEDEKPFVITGASGRVGGAVARLLLKKGYKVRAVARNVSKIALLKNDGAELFEADFTDAAKLTQAFQNAKAVFVLTPLNLLAENVNDEQRRNISGIITDLKNALVSQVVVLNSWGTELTEKSGGIMGNRLLEQELQKLPGLNGVMLLPVWFMENFLYNIDLIKMAGINGAAIKPDVKFPTVCTGDIAEVVISCLENLNSKGLDYSYVQSQREYTMHQVTSILGKAIGKPGMKYIEFPPSVMKQGMVGSGLLSPNAADMLVEINQCISSGLLKVNGAAKTVKTETTLEDFAKLEFAVAYAAAPNPSWVKKLQGFFLKIFLALAGKKLLKKEKGSYLQQSFA